MSDFGDHVPEMPTTPFLDDHAIEAIIDGDDVAAELRPLATFASGVRAEGDRRAPRPSPALARLIADGGVVCADPDAVTEATDPLASRRRLVVAKVAGLGLVAKLTLGAGAAAAGVVGAGAAGVLPGKANHVVRDAIEVVTPVDFSHGDDEGTPSGEPAGAGAGADHGDRVSSDATGESDGVPGVDGRETSEEAPGSSVRPSEPPGPDGAPGSSGEPGAPRGSLPETAPDRPADPRPPAASDGAPPSTTPATPTTQTTPTTPTTQTVDRPETPRGGSTGDTSAP